MAITALPDATIHLLGSAQVLTTPMSLVKELIDNSLDAKATSIDIIISSNTLDKLEVRDNGHGIPQEDLDALGRRGHTSKLRSFEELKSLGGITLGFRGEALASALQLGEVSVTTKTDGESVATKVKLKARGGIDQQTRASHPVGTTVSVLSFMAKLPVRKKTFEKEAAKTLAKINQLLQTYALARPSIKFSLKVTRGGKGSWSYSPRPSGDIRGAVSQVIGREAAMQCIEKSLVIPDIQSDKHVSKTGEEESNSSDMTPAISQCERFTIEAFLPMAGANPSKIGNGQYISIDARPVSYEKGTMKKIVTLFKNYIRSSFVETSVKVKNPFIRLEIRCPTASYDANVEPAKDDVLFENEPLVIESVERLLKDVYGECVFEPPAPMRCHLEEEQVGFELLLARKPPSAPLSDTPAKQSDQSQHAELLHQPHFLEIPSTIEQSGNCLTRAEESANKQPGGKSRKWGFDMSADYTEEAEGFERRDQTNKFARRTSKQPGDAEIASNSQNTLNPWVIAKMNTPTSRDRDSPLRDLAASVIGARTPVLHSDLISDSDICLTPKQGLRQTFPNDDIRAVQPSVEVSSHGQNPSNQRLELHFPGFSRPFLPVEFDDDLLLVDESEISYPTEPITFPEALPMSPPSTLISKRLRTSGDANRPFICPIKSVVGGKAIHNSVQTKLPPAFHLSSMQNNTSQATVRSPPDSDLAWAMDFEERKAAATRRRREELRNPGSMDNLVESTETFRQPDHQNPYNAAIANLEFGSHSTVRPKCTFQTSLPDDDPRAYLMKRQNSMAAQPVRPGGLPRQLRAKSIKLPMERITRGRELFPLVKVLCTDMEQVKIFTMTLLEDDVYVSRGSQVAGLVMSSTDTPGVFHRLHDTVKSWVASDGGKGYEVEFTCGNMTNAKLLGAA